MSSRNKVGPSAAARKNIRFAAASKNNRSAVAHKSDHAPLCLFTFFDGRRCRTPRTGNHPHFCFDHAQKETRARTAETIGKDLAYFFSGDYLSANDLSAALARLIPAVVRGDIKPKTARTVAYLAQTLLQSIRLAQHEYINALGTNGWRNAIGNSVSSNHDYLFPPAPPSPVVAGLQTGAVQASPVTAGLQTGAVHASPVTAGLQTGAVHAQQPAIPPIPTPVIPNPVAPYANGGEGSAPPSSVTPQPASAPSPTAPTPSPLNVAASVPQPGPHAQPTPQPASTPSSNPPQPPPVGHLGIPDPVGRRQPLPLPVRRRLSRTL
jgi:hypothetical protein